MNNCYMGKNEYRRTYLYDAEEETVPEVDRVDAFIDRLFSVLGLILASLLKLFTSSNRVLSACLAALGALSASSA